MSAWTLTKTSWQAGWWRSFFLLGALTDWELHTDHNGHSLTPSNSDRSTLLRYISLSSGWEINDDHGNPSSNGRDHLAGQSTTSQATLVFGKEEEKMACTVLVKTEQQFCQIL